MFLFLVLFLLYGRLVKPDTGILDGKNENSNGNYQGFQALPADSLDYLVIGSSNVFMDIAPTYIWDKFRLAGYNFVSPAQPLYISKFYLEEAIKTQTPKVVFLDALGLAMYEHASESYTHLGLDYFPLSYEKIKVVENLPYDPKSFIFPFLLYHSRNGELTKSDFNLLEYNPKENFLGYTPSYQSVPCEEPMLPSGGKYVTDNNLKYFNDIYRICNENDIVLVLLKTPNREWTAEMSEAAGKLAEEYGIEYIEFNYLLEEIGFDLALDFCDGGKHLNYNGAVKVSEYLGEYLTENFADMFPDKAEDIQAFYDGCADHLGHYEEVVKIRSMQDLDEILALGELYVILVSGQNVSDTAVITEYLDQKFAQVIYTNTYVALINGGQVNLVQDERDCSLEQKIDGKEFYLQNNMDSSVSKSKIQLNYRNYSKDGMVNIAIYDKVYGQIIDSFSVGMDNGEIVFVRN